MSIAEKEAWRHAILKAWRAGHYRRAVMILAHNTEDQGNAPDFIRRVTETMVPEEGWSKVR